MKAIGWIWSCAMLLAGMVLATGGVTPLAMGLLLSGLFALPALWDNEGPLGELGVSGKARAGLSIALIPMLGLTGVAHFDFSGIGLA